MRQVRKTRTLNAGKKKHDRRQAREKKAHSETSVGKQVDRPSAGKQETRAKRRKTTQPELSAEAKRGKTKMT